MDISNPKKSAQPPVLASRFLSWCLSAELKEPILGDLSEEFNALCMTMNRHRFATYWYWRQCIRTGFHFIWKTKRGLIMFTFSMLFFVLGTVFVVALSSGPHLQAFIDIPSLIIVIPTVVIFSIGTTSLNDFTYAFWLLIANTDDIDKSKAKSATRVFSVMGNTALLIGSLAMVIGWVGMATNITADEFSNVIGASFSISILTIFYGIFIKILCYIAEQKILHKIS